jgi:hypothetical protein
MTDAPVGTGRFDPTAVIVRSSTMIVWLAVAVPVSESISVPAWITTIGGLVGMAGC